MPGAIQTPSEKQSLLQRAYHLNRHDRQRVEGKEAQSGDGICPWLHSRPVAELGLFPESKSRAPAIRPVVPKLLRIVLPLAPVCTPPQAWSGAAAPGGTQPVVRGPRLGWVYGWERARSQGLRLGWGQSHSRAVVGANSWACNQVRLLSLPCPQPQPWAGNGTAASGAAGGWHGAFSVAVARLETGPGAGHSA